MALSLLAGISLTANAVDWVETDTDIATVTINDADTESDIAAVINDLLNGTDVSGKNGDLKKYLYVHVQGSKTNASEGIKLEIPEDSIVDWHATLEGAVNTEALVDTSGGLGEFAVYGGMISNTGSNSALYGGDQVYVTLAGGTISATSGVAIIGRRIAAANVSTVSVSADSPNPAIVITGEDGVLSAGSEGSIITINGDVVFENSGWFISSSGEINVTGNVTFYGDGSLLYCWADSLITITGDVTFNGEDSGVYARNTNSLVTISGDVTFIEADATLGAIGGGEVIVTGEVTFKGEYSGVDARDVDSLVTIVGGVVFEEEYSSLFAVDCGEISVSGYVTYKGERSGIYTWYTGSLVTITGDVTFNETDAELCANGGGEVKITGDVTFKDLYSEIAARYVDSLVTIVGGVVFEEESSSFFAYEGGEINVSGDVTLKGEMSGIYASKTDSLVTITGNVIFNETDAEILAYDGGKIGVTGSVTADKNDTERSFVMAGKSGEVTIGGNITTSGIGIEAWEDGKVTANGNVTALGAFGVGCYNVANVFIKGTLSVKDNKEYIYIHDEDASEGFFIPKEPFPQKKTIDNVEYYWYASNYATTSAHANVYIKAPASPTPTPTQPTDIVSPDVPLSSFPDGYFLDDIDSHVIGSEVDLVYIVETEFEQFSFVQVDDATLTNDTYFKAESGSIKITLFADYLDTLETGTHTLTVGFKDSTSVTAQFTITDGSATTGMPEVPFPFTDVPETAWYYNDVKIAWEMGLVNGTGLTTYSPNKDLTYAEAVKLAACMHQLYTTGEVTLVNGSPWYQSYVDYAKENGIISKDYEWKAPATRMGYMEIFAKALPKEAFEAINEIEDDSIPDVPMTHPLAAEIYKLYRAGIVQGNNEHYCRPDAPIRRSEVAAILARMMVPEERIEFAI